MSGSENSNGGSSNRPSNSELPRIGRIGQWGSSSSTPSSRPGSSASGGPRIASLRDLGNSGGSGPRPPPRTGADGNAGDDNKGGEGENWFTGGERSGLAVQNPNFGRRDDIPGGEPVRELLRKAAAAGPAKDPESTSGNLLAFSGTGHTLGSDEVESQTVPDPNEPQAPEQEKAIRHIAFYRNGFTIENGPLLDYNDPQNAETLRLIQQGQAPPEVLNVHWQQLVELRVSKRVTEDYVAPPAGPARAFEGAGNRLGAPMPGSSEAGSSGTTVPAAPEASSSGDSTDRPSLQTKWEVDRTQPTAQIRLRLPTNPRYPVTLNLSHTVGDLRNLINATGLGDATRTYNLFPADEPSRILDDESVTIGDAKLDRRVVVLQLI